MHQRVAYILLLLLVHAIAFAQHYYIRGEVKDEDGNPLSNVTILQHSTGYVYYSGSSGSFGLTAAQKTDTLTFSLHNYYSRQVAVSAERFETIVLQKKPTGSFASHKLASLTQNLTRDLQRQWTTGEETYLSLVENRFINAGKYPSTGVRINVDRASYSNIRRFLKMGAPVPPDAVRIEEMLNYFNFDYQPPPPGQTFAIRPVLTSCPWNAGNQLLFVSISSRKLLLDSLPPSHLVFLIDVSGSMDMPNRLPLLKAGFRSLVNNLRPVDSVSIVVYGGLTGVLLQATSGGEKQKILKVIDSLEPSGATPGESGIRLAYSVARNHFIREGNNRVILATDGDFNVGLRSEEELEELIERQQKMGIYLTCLGVGMGNYKDSKIQTLARKGKGNFAYIDGYAEAEKVLLQEFLQTLYTVADDVSFRVNFNPGYVKEYRLIGFDNKAGAIRDSTAVVEGGEVGPAYSVLILFELVPANTETSAGQLQTVMPARFVLHYRIPGNGLPQEQQEEPVLSLTPWQNLQKTYQLAGAVSLFGMLLRESRYCKGAGWDDVLALAKPAVDEDQPAQKEFLTLVHQAKSLYPKKRKKK